MANIISLLLWLTLMFLQANPSEGCLKLGSAMTKRLTSFVSSKYKLGGATDLALRDEGLIADGCYRKIILETTTPHIRQITLCIYRRIKGM